MATPLHNLIQDQNLNVLHNGATPGGKINNAKADKKGLGGRKALNDISNSRRPSTIQSTKKQSSIDVISVEKDPREARAKASKVPEKGATGGRRRKALTDLTNSVKPSSQKTSRAGLKLSTWKGENYPSSILEEGFLHNHQECIKAQIKAADMDYFLETVGLKHDTTVENLPSSREAFKSKLENSIKCLEEIPDEIFEVEVPQCKKLKLSDDHCSPVHQSPKPSFSEDDSFTDDLRVLYP